MTQLFNHQPRGGRFFFENFRRSEVPLLGGSAFRMLRSCCSVGMTCHLVWVILYVLYHSKSPFFHHHFGRRCVGTFPMKKKQSDPKFRPLTHDFTGRPKITFKRVTDHFLLWVFVTIKFLVGTKKYMSKLRSATL